MPAFRPSLLPLLCAALSCTPGVSGQTPLSAPTLGEPGPWGRLQSFEVVLEPSDPVLADPFYARPLDSWAFPLDWSPSQIATALLDAGIPSREVTTMLGPESLKTNPVAQWFVPTESAILSLSPDQREKLYTLLGQWKFNPYHQSPFVLGVGTVTSRAEMATHAIPGELIDLADSLSYGTTPNRFFADYPLICRRLPDEASRLKFARLLLRNRTLMARLRPAPDRDASSILAYWSAGGKNPGALPLLESLMEGGSVEPIDIVHLLPPLPKRLLYTYGTKDLAVGNILPDCFWTSLHFFEEGISNRYLDPVVGEIVERDWAEVQPPYQLGDLLLITRRDTNESVHACNYVADDIVFTKNGQSLVRPWILQRLDDVRAAYQESGVHDLTAHRHRSLMPKIRQPAKETP
jgi:hypothetical protein